MQLANRFLRLSHRILRPRVAQHALLLPVENPIHPVQTLSGRPAKRQVTQQSARHFEQPSGHAPLHSEPTPTHNVKPRVQQASQLQKVGADRVQRGTEEEVEEYQSADVHGGAAGD